MSNARPLEGLTVVAIEHAVAAPYCTSRLADAGARVIKIERPEGDFARGYDKLANGQSSYFVWLNRGKESLVLDLTVAADRAVLQELIASADIVVQNMKPGMLDRFGLGVGELRQRHPKLILCSISGYGESGPLSARKAYDLLIQAESGLCAITGGPAEPSRVGFSVVDIATGAMAYTAILEALLARAVSNDGADIRISMFDVMADWMAVPLLQHEGGQSPKRVGLAHPSIAPYSVFTCKDGKDILISIQNDREWAALCTEFIGAPAAATDPKFATNVARVENRPATDAMVAQAFARYDSAAAQARLTNADIAFAALNDMAALSAHPHLRRITVGSPNGPVSLPAPAAVFVGAARDYGDIPALGAHAPLPDARD